MVKTRDTIELGDDHEVAIDAWLQQLLARRPEADAGTLVKTAEYLRSLPGTAGPEWRQRLEEGLEIADILAEMRLDFPALAAALLHPSVRDGLIDPEQARERLGQEVMSLVDGVGRMSAIQDLYQADEAGHYAPSGENLRKMLLAMAEDVRVVLVKLAEWVITLRRGRDADEDRRRQIARETMEIYAPLANRLGIGQIKWELEDLAFRFLDPATYKHIARLLEERRVDRERYIERVVERLRGALAEVGIEAEVLGRVKHIHSIWRKMKRKNLDYHQIYDIRAVRILVDSVPECYAALGIVHTLWNHIPREFDDYIATPKENGYRSLHTAVIGPQGRNLEVQIRTHEMNQQSELGVAAHWRYKEGLRYDSGFEAKIAWLRQLLSWQEELFESDNLAADLRSAVAEDRVYVFTPMGKVVDLPQGSTPLDFAYHIHTELGHRCRGAKVNGRIVPLNYTLRTGEQIEVLTAARGTPSRDWLNANLGYLATARARSKVQHWFRLQDFDKNLTAGKAIMDRELRRLTVKPGDYDLLAEQLNFKKGDDLLAAVGAGDIRPSQVIAAINALYKLEPQEVESLPVSQPRDSRQATDVQVLGVGNLLTHVAGCCKPLPGDPIVGYITRGWGVTIHRRDCGNVLGLRRRGDERLIEVEWGLGTVNTYPVDVHIRAFDRQGLLRDITALLANERINVIAVNTRSDKSDHTADMTLTLEIANLDQLGKVLDQVNALPNVMEVQRRR